MPQARFWRNTYVHVALIVLFIAGVQLALPTPLSFGPEWLIPAIEVLGIPLLLWLRRYGDSPVGRVERMAMMFFLFVLSAACTTKAATLVLALIRGNDGLADGLLVAALGVLLVIMLSFGIIYWWIDGGSPAARASGIVEQSDLLFPQQSLAGRRWSPHLADYLYTAYTNSIAFSPTDTMPLTLRAKFLFTLQSSTSLLTVLVTLSTGISLLN